MKRQPEDDSPSLLESFKKIRVNSTSPTDQPPLLTILVSTKSTEYSATNELLHQLHVQRTKAPSAVDEEAAVSSNYANMNHLLHDLHSKKH